MKTKIADNNISIKDSTTAEVNRHINEGAGDSTFITLSQELAEQIVNEGQHLDKILRSWAWLSLEDDEDLERRSKPDWDY